MIVFSSPFTHARQWCLYIVRWPLQFLFAFLSLVSMVQSAEPDEPPPASVSFQKDIRAILSDNCFLCHGPDESTREAGLRLDVREVAVEEFGAIVPGDIQSSSLWERITTDDETLKMPPSESGKQLSASERDKIRQWIEQGASWEEHWAFVAPKRHAAPLAAIAPSAKDHALKNEVHLENEIDAFVLNRLRESGLQFSPPADVSQLARRVSLDLIGVAPKPLELQQFVAANGSRWYERFVDQLLSNSAFGEKWAQHWLDAARYADSDGFEKDKPRFVWAYRDWVVHALNEDMPYDEFVIQQLAGDLLPEPTQANRVATGFLRNSMINEEGGVDPEQFRMEAVFDRMDAVGKSILGITLACSQCHDHKYDPISQRDYYKIFAFLNNSHEGSIPVFSESERDARAETLSRVDAVLDRFKQANPDWEQSLALWESKVKSRPLPWQVIRPEWNFDSLGGTKHLLQPDGSFLAASYAPTKSAPFGWVQLNAEEYRGRAIAGFRVEVMPHPDLPRGGPGRSTLGTAGLSEFRVEATKVHSDGTLADSKSLSFHDATASLNATTEPLPAQFDDRDSNNQRSWGPVHFAIDGDVNTAWRIDDGPFRTRATHEAVFPLIEPYLLEADTRMKIVIEQKHGGWNSDDNQTCNLGRFRISLMFAEDHETVEELTGVAPLRACEVSGEILALLRETSPESRTREQSNQILVAWIKAEKEFAEYSSLIDSMESEVPWGTSQLVLEERDERRPTYVLAKGDFLSPTELVQPGTPAFLHPLSSDHPNSDQLSANSVSSPSRLEFAEWLVSTESPTTARAAVNRIWQELFGTGLSRTTEDLGSQSELPTHPELLDTLAVDFMEHDWSLKRLIRKLVMSTTYRQSSAVHAVAHSIDPDNRLLSYFPAKRLRGEVLRDSILATSGLLSRKIGGAPVYPPAPGFLFQPPVSYGPKRWDESVGADRYRRSLYVFRFRTIPYPPLQNFDAPNGDASCVRRAESNTPLQALTTLNEDVFVECAQAFARQAFYAIPHREDVTPLSDAQRIAWLFRSATGREPTDEETFQLAKALVQFRTRVTQSNNDAQASAKMLEDLVGDNNPSLELLPLPDVYRQNASELASWVLLSRVVLNLDETVAKY